MYLDIFFWHFTLYLNICFEVSKKDDEKNTTATLVDANMTEINK